MTEPLLHRGRLLMALDRPLMGGQLPALSPQRPLPRDPHPPLGLLDPGHRLITVAATLHDRPRSVEQAGQFDSPR